MIKSHLYVQVYNIMVTKRRKATTFFHTVAIFCTSEFPLYVDVIK